MALNIQPATSGSAALEGRWGGDRALLTVGAGSAQLELECASGHIPGPIELNAAGRFERLGAFEEQRPGPQNADAAAAPNNVRYAGEVQDQVLTLQVWPTAGGAPLVFKLRKGAKVKMVRCY